MTGADFFPPRVRSISAASEMYSALEVPGFWATLTLPGMWLMANSKEGRTSKTGAVFSSSARRNSSVETSGVLALLSPKVAFCMLGADWASMAPARSKNAQSTGSRFMVELLVNFCAGQVYRSLSSQSTRGLKPNFRSLLVARLKPCPFKSGHDRNLFQTYARFELRNAFWTRV